MLAITVYDTDHAVWKFPTGTTADALADGKLHIRDAHRKVLGVFNERHWSHYAINTFEAEVSTT